MPICKKCGASFPNRIEIDGKQHVVCRRKYCLDCSPFGKHNTRQIEKAKAKRGPRKCKICGRDFHGSRSRICSSCYAKRRREHIREKIHTIVGDSCWLCGYSKGAAGRSILSFHHVVPKNKSFDLNVANMTCHSWDKVASELDKCVLLCCRCHREYHCGLVDDKEIWRIYNNR